MAVRLQTAFRRLARAQSGFTLVETMFVAATLSVILIAILNVSDVAQKTVPKDQERANVISEAKTGLHGMTRELRQATAVYVTSPTTIEVDAPFRGVSTRISYRCDEPHPTNSDWRRCVRVAGTNSRMVIDRVLNDDDANPVFTYTTDPQNGQPTYVAVRLDVPAAGDRKDGHKHKVILEDGFYMRNVDVTP